MNGKAKAKRRAGRAAAAAAVVVASLAMPGMASAKEAQEIPGAFDCAVAGVFVPVTMFAKPGSKLTTITTPESIAGSYVSYDINEFFGDTSPRTDLVCDMNPFVFGRQDLWGFMQVK